MMDGVVRPRMVRRVLQLPLLLAIIMAFGAIAATPGLQSPAEAAGETTDIVLVGDSYSAGNGAGNYYGPDNCYRSNSNWAERYAAWLKNNGYPATFTNVACNGATTHQFFNRNPRPGDGGSYNGVCLGTPQSPDEYIDSQCKAWLKPQIEAINSSTDLVVLTLGGNDIGFKNIVYQCFVPAYRDPGDCRYHVKLARDRINDPYSDGLKERLKLVLTKIHEKNPKTRVVLLGYPHLVGDTYPYVLKSLLGTDSYDAGREVRLLNEQGTAKQLEVVNAVNTQYGKFVTYIQANKWFNGREPDPRPGSSNPARWLLEVWEDKTISLQTLYHPNPQGHNGYFELLKGTIGSPDWVPTPVPNQPPKASFTYKRLPGAGNIVSFDGNWSSDVDGRVTGWRWTLGSTVIATRPTPTVALGAGTSKTVTLTVTDNRGATGAVTKTLSLPNRPPVITSVAPVNGSISGTTTPVLSARATDDDADPLKFAFRVTGPSVDISSGWVGSSWRVPQHRLDPGTRYQWAVTVRDPSGATASRTTGFTVAMLPTAADVVPTSTGAGYWQVDTYGGVFSYGDARFHGSLPGLGVRVNNIMGMARTYTNSGYWLVGRDGGVFAFGDAPFFGSLPGLGIRVTNIVGMAPTRTGKGYWLVGSDGGVFAFGDAGFFGSMGGKPLNAPVEGIAPTPSNAGYWLAARDGGIFAFGDAPFFGSMGGKPLNAPVVDLDVTPDGKGYWMTAEDGGVFAFGNAGFFGSMAGKPLNGHITGMAATPNGKGYFLNGCDGGIFAFGNAVFRGSNPTYQCRGV